MRPTKYIVRLTDEQVQLLNDNLKHQRYNPILKRHAQILLDADVNHGAVHTRAEIALLSRTTPSTVIKVVKLFLDGGLEQALAYHRNPISDRTNQKMSGADQARIIQLACGPAPEGHSRWSLSLLEEAGKLVLDVPVKRDAIGRMLKKRKLSLTKLSTGQFPHKKTPTS